jgi:hypothetical protein
MPNDQKRESIAEPMRSPRVFRRSEIIACKQEKIVIAGN